MSEPKGDNGDIDAGLKKVHGRCVAKGMRGYGLRSQSGMIAGCQSDSQREPLCDVGSCHGRSAAIWEQTVASRSRVQMPLP